MAKIMINVRELQAVKNGLLRFDTETKNFEVMDETGNWIVSNSGITNIDNAENVESAESVVSASTVVTAESVSSAGTVENVHTHNDTILNVSGTDTFVVLSQTEYDNLAVKNANTFYLIEDE
jgi:hypothetical protein